MEVKLVVLTGKQKDREIPLPRTMFLIGRDVQCHLRVHSPLISRRHCAIACWAGKVSVRDLKSVNGTFVNNQRVAGEVKVKDGDHLQVGPLAFAFRIKDAAVEESPAKITPGSLRWLMEQGREAPPVDTLGSTVFELMGNAGKGGSEPDATAETAPSMPAISPGTYLQEYLTTRKKPPGPLPRG
jgi:pSer/pThr/pTyr-binding forkhead associated (FHA) protein